MISDENDSRNEPCAFCTAMAENARQANDRLARALEGAKGARAECDEQDQRIADLEQQVAHWKAENRRLTEGLNLALDDLGALLRALGESDCARPETPHHVMMGCIRKVAGLRTRIGGFREAILGLRAAHHSGSREEWEAAVKVADSL